MVVEVEPRQKTVQHRQEVPQTYEEFCRGLTQKLTTSLATNEGFREYAARKATGQPGLIEDTSLHYTGRGYLREKVIVFPHRESVWLYVTEETPEIARHLLSRRDPKTNNITAIEVVSPVNEGRIRGSTEPPLADISCFKLEKDDEGNMIPDKVFDKEALREVEETLNLLKNPHS